ncbi:MAG: type I-E CRISPR-associated protein Cas6/Cse3/CasE [Clostridiales bacterium]|jgi:CRISPR system Cascade subunit CasE|nr:type I-E CRISPR-associated protein Cas6/Cse3/CasE [Clostridiales bacterium]
MFLSRIELNTNDLEAKRALTSPQVIHAALEACFEENAATGRLLWRIDRLYGKIYLLLFSAMPPNLTEMSNRLSPSSTGETKDYSGFLAQIQAGQSFRFRLKANPVHSVGSREYGVRGKIYGHVTIEQKRAWLVNKAKSCGFETNESLEITEAGQVGFKKKSHRVSFSMAVYEGFLTVTDRELFIKSLTQGIGRAKAYGFGLLTVAHI